MQCRIPRGAGAPLGTYARTAPPEASRFLLPPARRCRSSPPRKARRRALLQTPRPAGRRAWQGAALGRAAHARHAGRVPALPASAWPLPPVGPPERRAEAGCRIAGCHRRGGYRRPVRSTRLLVFCLGGRARLLFSSLFGLDRHEMTRR